MTTATTPLREQERDLDRLATDTRDRHRGHLREFRIEVAEGGVVLHGVAAAFYGKQLAQQALLRRGFHVIANRIVVVSRPVGGGGA
jgi:hypothetical protein